MRNFSTAHSLPGSDRAGLILRFGYVTLGSGGAKMVARMSDSFETNESILGEIALSVRRRWEEIWRSCDVDD
jgi:hypothetical protein